MNLIDRRPLTESDYQAFERIGVPREMVDHNDIFRVDDHEGARMTGREHLLDQWHRYSGIVFPVRWPGDDRILDYRLRRDVPDAEMQPDGEVKESAKYLSAPRSKSLLYFPRDADPAWLDDASMPKVICEGEKKCLALWVLALYGLQPGQRPRFLPIALPGVWNFRKSDTSSGRKVATWIEDLEKIKWAGCRVTILFDSNIHWNESVRAARAKLAYLLRAWDAQVLFAELPNDPSVNGIDDFVEVNGPVKALAIVAKAFNGTWDECKDEKEYYLLAGWAQMNDVARLLFACWGFSPESVQLFDAIHGTWGGRSTKEFRLRHEDVYQRMMPLPGDATTTDKRRAREFVRDRLKAFEAQTDEKLTIRLIEVVERGGRWDAEKGARLNTKYRVRHAPFLEARREADRIMKAGTFNGQRVKSPGLAREIAARIVAERYLLANAKESVKEARQAELKKRADAKRLPSAQRAESVKRGLLSYVSKKAEDYYQTLYAESEEEGLSHIEIASLMVELSRDVEKAIRKTCEKLPRKIKAQIEERRKLEDTLADEVGGIQPTHSAAGRAPAEPTHPACADENESTPHSPHLYKHVAAPNQGQNGSASPPGIGPLFDSIEQRPAQEPAWAQGPPVKDGVTVKCDFCDLPMPHGAASCPSCGAIYTASRRRATAAGPPNGEQGYAVN